MSRYPKPAGWNGGPDGSIQRQGSAGHKSFNPFVESGNTGFDDEIQKNVQDFDDADLGGCDDD
jgi:hypothetical protein